jgi:hypothetical protein
LDCRRREALELCENRVSHPRGGEIAAKIGRSSACGKRVDGATTGERIQVEMGVRLRLNVLQDANGPLRGLGTDSIAGRTRIQKDD